MNRTSLRDNSGDVYSLADAEFFRSCIIVVPRPGEKPFRAVLVEPEKKGGMPRIFCDCSRGRYADCSHANALKRLYAGLMENAEGLSPTAHYLKSPVCQLANALFNADPHPLKSASIVRNGADPANVVEIRNSPAMPIATYSAALDENAGRLMQRMGAEGGEHSRRRLMERCAAFIMTETENALNAEGHLTSRQAEEAGVWFSLSYHWYREHGGVWTSSDVTFAPTDGRMRMVLKVAGASLTIMIPHTAAPRCLQILWQNGFPRWRESPEVELLFRIAFPDDDSVVVQPVVKPAADGPLETVDNRFLYGNLLYLPAIDQLVKFSMISMKILAQGWKSARMLPRDRLSAFLEEFREQLSFPSANGTSDQQNLFSAGGGNDFGRLVDFPIIRKFDTVELRPTSVDRDWLYLSDVIYGAGIRTVSLRELLAARKQKRRYAFLGGGFVDLESDEIDSIIIDADPDDTGGLVVSRPSILQFNIIAASSLRITGAPGLKDGISLCTLRTLRPLRGYAGCLRHYQESGVNWLLFLYDNRFGGLLCDDMGLGKTHQAIALMLAAREQRTESGRMLIVCPATVVCHWERLLADFAPSLGAATFYGTERAMAAFQAKKSVTITSYGILRKDIDELAAIEFDAVFFDEAHNLKNAQTGVNQAARMLKARVRFGLTGTPVENSLIDLKTLFDISLPGYLGNDAKFNEKFRIPIESSHEERARQKLRRVISPFVLRRLKQTVLAELPPKIEETRTCLLSEEQTGLYREAILGKGQAFIAALNDLDKPVPYMHIFVLLNLLKEICNHPALALDRPRDYMTHVSGKWDLFAELLDESMGAGQKVVVFTQYLGMVEMISAYLSSQSINHTTLTGQSRNRGSIIRSFNEDPACRVFIGSLKAGGTGIDLTAASVVIHYDRWWNAAREDQATDRVHRIGQTRGVQVFKLVTQGTLEEKIDAIISRKKYAAAVIAEDPAESVKTFTREELLELLKF
jgi:superfamily II DNA or RNA helicase